ncbi:MAG: 3'(2'),5'-bisphosphate nucleotidase CysQ [Alphaproteobacteria bacterium]|nr:3'(2'),5'-bisphosphate nucleotidase CysQ [Alphaproteobacteria bacterium]
MLNDRAALCEAIRNIALEAGKITLKYFNNRKDAGITAKGDGSPVTLADQEAEKLINERLLNLLPHVPIIGEEAVSESAAPDLKDREDYFWLVDPLDGTKEFIGGGGDYTVNIALIHNRKPVLGVVYAPAKGELYAGYDDKALFWDEKTGEERPVRVRQNPPEGLSVVASKSHGDEGKLGTFLKNYKVNELIKCGSSLKICVIAAGQADLYPRFGPTCEWDTAAGDAVLRAAGGFMSDEHGGEMIYGGRNEKWLNPEFIASAFDWRAHNV